MHSPLIFDLIPLSVLALFALLGAKRGLFKTLSGLAVLLLALLGAALLAGRLADPVTDLLYPRLEGMLIDRLASQYAVSADEQSSKTSLQDDFSELFDFSDSLGSTLDDMREAGMNAARTAARAALRGVVQTVLFLLFFLALMLLLKLLCKPLALIFKLPLLHTMDRLGGFVLGLAEGALICFAALTLLQRLGWTFFPDHVQGTYLISFFLNNTPRSLLAALLR